MVRQAATGDVYAAIADPTRRRILDRLERGDLTVSEIAAPFRVSQPAVSQHLRVLRDAGLVTPRKDGRFRRYRLNPGGLRHVYDWVAHYKRFWEKKLTRLGEFLNEQP